MKKQGILRLVISIAILAAMLLTLAACAGAQGPQGEQGIPGKDGETPTISISDDGYWVINGVKTEHKAVGTDGKDGQDGEDGKDGVDGKPGQDGEDGKDGIDGTTPTIEISADGYWIINGVKTDHCVCDCDKCEHSYVTAYVLESTCALRKVLKECEICGYLTVLDEEPIIEHNYVDRVCTVCGALEPSEGLEFTLNSDKSSYRVSNIGTCTDSDIVIPSTYSGLPVTSIGSDAFYDCDSLTSVTIPDSVTSIGERAFAYCDSLTSITIPASVTSIGSYTFLKCDSLTSITIPANVTSIGSGAFENCDSLTSITVDENNQYYKDIDGNLYTKDGKALIQYAIGKKDTSFTIPASVTSIGNYAFYYCSSLTSVTIPSDVTSIGNYAFVYCDSLTSITIPDSVRSIGSSAFTHCDSLTSVYYTGTASEWGNISIGSNNSYLTNATRYYYSEAEPTVSGNYWHYVDGEIVVW